MAQRKFRPGITFKDGKLYSFPSAYRVVVARGWPEIRAWTRTTKSPWLACRGLADTHVMKLLDRRFDVTPLGADGAELDLDSADANDPLLSGEYSKAKRRAESARRQSAAVHDFFATFPLHLLDALRAFPERRWHMASMAARCPGAVDLIESNPALAVALSSWWIFRPNASRANEMRAIRSRVNKPQREIAEWLGFGADESTRRILAKVPPANCTIHRILHLRNALEHPVMKERLAHAPKLTWSVLLIGCRQELVSLVSPSFLADPAVSYHAKPYKLLDDLMTLRRLLIGDADGFTECALKSLEHLRRLLASGVLNAQMALPVQDDLTLVPLLTGDDLIVEAAAMKNCLAAPAYAERLRCNRAQYFRLLSPERGTVMVEQGSRGPEISQAWAQGNAALSRATWDLLMGWIKQYRRPTPSTRPTDQSVKKS